MAFWTYILICADRSYYTGHTDDLEKRIGQHVSGQVKGFTSGRLPVELVWAEYFASRIEALEAERRIKGWSRAKKEALIAGDWAAIQRLAARRTSFETGPFEAAAGGSQGKLRSRSVPPQDERNLQQAVRAEEALRPQAEAPSRSTPPPIIVLVRPQLGENIGKAARAMLNFGLTEMRLVAPRDGWPNPDAGPAAAGADIVLEQAQIFATLAEAVADCAHIYATTVRRRGLVKPVVNAEQAASQITAAPQRSAVIFGPERSGLETDEVALARNILTVPINPEFGSLNLAQAVILVAYEWSKTQSLASPPTRDLDPPAAQSELDGLIDHLDSLLETTGYFYPPDRAPATRRTLRSVLTKPGWNANEVRTLRGVLSALEKPRPK